MQKSLEEAKRIDLVRGQLLTASGSACIYYQAVETSNVQVNVSINTPALFWRRQERNRDGKNEQSPRGTSAEYTAANTRQ